MQKGADDRGFMEVPLPKAKRVDRVPFPHWPLFVVCVHGEELR
jgi:hypothetical protein